MKTVTGMVINTTTILMLTTSVSFAVNDLVRRRQHTSTATSLLKMQTILNSN